MAGRAPEDVMLEPCCPEQAVRDYARQDHFCVARLTTHRTNSLRGAHPIRAVAPRSKMLSPFEAKVSSRLSFPKILPRGRHAFMANDYSEGLSPRLKGRNPYRPTSGSGYRR
jgi:hypothetical protein